MDNVTEQTINNTHKPFDIVTNLDGDVGFIQEVNINDCQPHKDDQISYAVKWLVGNETKHAWFRHYELRAHGNLFVIIAECACNSTGRNSHNVQMLFDHTWEGEYYDK